jgi:hypothetical protein
MAFNVGKFVKSSAKSVGNRILQDVITAASSKLPLNTVIASRSTAESLFNVGASYQSISAFATQRTDALVRDNAEEYFALAGKDPARASASDVASVRRDGINRDTARHLNEINPTTKIRMKKREASEAYMDLTPKVDLPGSGFNPREKVNLPGSSPVPTDRVRLP